MDDLKLGTPKTLQEAILRELLVGPLSDVDKRLEAALRDFLAQRFGVAYLKAKTSRESMLLRDLWAAIVKKESEDL